jgi:hypothetical protein
MVIKILPDIIEKEVHIPILNPLKEHPFPKKNKSPYHFLYGK